MMFYSSSNYLMFQNVIFFYCSFTALAFFAVQQQRSASQSKVFAQRKWDKSDSSYAAGVTVEISKDSSNYSFLFSHNIAPKNRISSKGALLKDRRLGGGLSVVMVGTASGNHFMIENSAQNNKSMTLMAISSSLLSSLRLTLISMSSEVCCDSCL